MSSDAKAADIVMPGDTSVKEMVNADGGSLDEVPVVPEVEPEQAVEAAPSESSPDTGDNQEKKHDGVQKRINDLTAKRYAADRRGDSAEARVRELEAELQTAKPAIPSEVIEAPKLPDDMYDEEAMRAYHNDMAQYSVNVAKSASKQSFEDQQRAAQENTQKQQAQDVLTTYSQNAVKDGADLDKVKAGEQMMAQRINPALGRHIMSDPNGAKIVEYLYDNPDEMDLVLSMDPVSAGVKIQTEIKTKALSTTPLVSNAPEPTPEIGGGGGTGEKDDFARKYPSAEFI